MHVNTVCSRTTKKGKKINGTEKRRKITTTKISSSAVGHINKPVSFLAESLDSNNTSEAKVGSGKKEEGPGMILVATGRTIDLQKKTRIISLC
jgi:hypothetical protein